MATLYTQQSRNVRKSWFLMTMFLVIVIAIGWTFSQIYGNSVILYIAIAFSLVMNISSYWFSDKIVLKMSGANRIEKKDNPELYRLVENLAITAGLKLPKIYIMDDPAPNAFATGRDEEHAVVAVTTGLLERLNKVELEGVIAHELSHIGNKDILISTIVVVLVGFIALLSDLFLRFTIFGGMRRDNNGDGRVQLIMMVVGIALAILAPIAAVLIQMAISRKREFLADASGALLTRYPEGLASALEKISSYNVPMKKASKATAHLYISNPFGNIKSKRGLKRMFLTHPPVEERLKALRGK